MTLMRWSCPGRPARLSAPNLPSLSSRPTIFSMCPLVTTTASSLHRYSFPRPVSIQIVCKRGGGGLDQPGVAAGWITRAFGRLLLFLRWRRVLSAPAGCAEGTRARTHNRAFNELYTTHTHTHTTYTHIASVLPREHRYSSSPYFDQVFLTLKSRIGSPAFIDDQLNDVLQVFRMPGHQEARLGGLSEDGNELGCLRETFTS